MVMAATPSAERADRSGRARWLAAAATAGVRSRRPVSRATAAASAMPGGKGVRLSWSIRALW